MNIVASRTETLSNHALVSAYLDNPRRPTIMRCTSEMLLKLKGINFRFFDEKIEVDDSLGDRVLFGRDDAWSELIVR